MLLLSSCVRYKPVLYRNGRIELVFVMKDYPRVLNCYREIWVSPKIRQVDRVVNEYSSTVELVVHTYDGRRVIAAYSTFVDQLHYFDLSILSRICCITCSHSCAAIGKISTGILALCGPSVVAELLVSSFITNYKFCTQLVEIGTST